MYRMFSNENMPGAFSQSATATGLAGLGVHVATEFFPDQVGFRIFVTPLHVWQNAFECMIASPWPAAVSSKIGERNFFRATAIQKYIAYSFG